MEDILSTLNVFCYVGMLGFRNLYLNVPISDQMYGCRLHPRSLKAVLWKMCILWDVKIGIGAVFQSWKNAPLPAKLGTKMYP